MLFDFQCDTCGKHRQVRFDRETFGEDMPCSCGGRLCKVGVARTQPRSGDPSIDRELRFTGQSSAEAAELRAGGARGMM